jgi:hypothetical protein
MLSAAVDETVLMVELVEDGVVALAEAMEDDIEEKVLEAEDADEELHTVIRRRNSEN